VDVILLQSPLKGLRQDLVMHKLCSEIALERLTEQDVAQYLSKEFPGSGALTELVHRHSEGNPLFMTAIVSDLVKSGLLAEENGSWKLTAPLEQIVPDVPETLQQMLEIQVERLSEPEQRVLKSASVAGSRFSAWSVAAMLGTGAAETEETCERFAERQQFLRPGRAAGVLGATQSAHYEFRHSLYREALYRRVPPAQRSRLHRLLAEKAQELLEQDRIRTGLRTGLAFRAWARLRARGALFNSECRERRPPLRASRCRHHSAARAGIAVGHRR
jgi:predicted ATPase